MWTTLLAINKTVIVDGEHQGRALHAIVVKRFVDESKVIKSPEATLLGQGE